MLDEGTTSRSASAIALAAESIATSLSASCGWDGSYIGFRCLAPHLELTLDLATDLLLNPTFPADEWDRVRGQTLAHLRADHDRADSRAYRSFLRSIYGPGHPYSLPADGSAETVERLGLDQLHAFHAARYRPDQAAWVVAGDIDPDQLARRLDTLLSTWSGHAGSPPAIEPPPLAPRRRIVVAHRPGAPQAAVRIGQVGIPRQDPDHLDLVVLNQILGGQFISRLNTRIREEKGLTYGIRSSFDSRRGAGPFAVASSIQADRVAEAIADVVHEIEALLGDRPPSPAELDDARRSLVDGQARQFETPAELVSRFAGLFLHGLPADHHATLRDRLDRVGPDSVVSAGARHLRPSALTAVVAADADQVAGPLQALGWAVVELEG
jgi:predicted Zn-dependent peptidase